MAHHCHFPNCRVSVPPKMWGCKPHWFMLPANLRAAIWREYRPGQEKDKRPSRAYVDVAKRVQTYIREHLQDETAHLAALIPPKQRALL